LAAFEQQLTEARANTSRLEAAVEAARTAHDRAEQRAEQAVVGLRRAEQAVEEARRGAARVGGELAAVDQFLRTQAGKPGGAAVLAEQLVVDPGYELAVAAALDGRLRAAVVADHAGAREVLDQAGPEGGRALIAGGTAGGDDPATASPGDNAEHLLDHIRGPSPSLELARVLLCDTWIVESLESVPPGFGGVAVTRRGRVWSTRTREVRQAPAVGEERVLAERNRREQLIQATEQAAQREIAAGEALAQATQAYHQTEGEREQSTLSYRRTIRERDEAGEQETRIEAMIERRRSAPGEDSAEERRRQLERELADERDRVLRRERLRQQLSRDEQLRSMIASVVETLEGVEQAIVGQRGLFEAELEADREAGEEVSAQLRSCAQEEAAIQGQLHASAQEVTDSEVGFLRARDRAAELEQELRTLAARLELDASPAEDELGAEEREALVGRLERLARRREQLGPVNPLARQEYAEAVEHVEELERQREDLETALRELEKLIIDTDRQIRDAFEQTFAAAALNFEQVVQEMFPGGSGRLRLVKDNEGQARVLGGAEVTSDSDGEESAEIEPEEERLGVEIEINPAGKEMKRLTLLSGGEKSMTALAFLFAVFLARPCPFYILDEVEAALDDLNIDRFLALLRSYSERAQFIVVTHQRRTMEAADILYGVSMGADGVSKVISQRLAPAAEAA
jgi:chromosome segregation protein